MSTPVDPALAASSPTVSPDRPEGPPPVQAVAGFLGNQTVHEVERSHSDDDQDDTPSVILRKRAGGRERHPSPRARYPEPRIGHVRAMPWRGPASPSSGHDRRGGVPASPRGSGDRPRPASSAGVALNEHQRRPPHGRNEPPWPHWRTAPQPGTPNVHGTGTVIGVPGTARGWVAGGKPGRGSACRTGGGNAAPWWCDEDRYPCSAQ
jgi:hypothetical protein